MSHKAHRFQNLTEEERFWLKVDKRGPDECWPWRGALNPNKYGKFKRSDGKAVDAHRHALSLKLGRPLLKHEVARHRCDYRPCCNQEHLEPGTQKHNIWDMIERGRAKFFGREVPPPAHTMLPRDHPDWCPF